MIKAVENETGPDSQKSRVYTADQLEAVVRRAAELQSLRDGGEAPEFSESDLVRIAGDVGVSADFVREALNEMRTRELIREDSEEHPLVRWAFGSAQASVSRRIAGQRDALQPRLETVLETDHGLQPMRRGPGLSVWEPAGDLVNTVQRWFDFSGRRYRLAEAEAVTLNVAAWDRTHCLVNLNADLSKQRNERLTGWGVGLGIGLFFAWGLLSEADSVFAWLLLPPALAVGIGAAVAEIRYHLRQERRRFRLVLEGVLDRLVA